MSPGSKAFTLIEVLIGGSLAAVLFFLLCGLLGRVSGVVSRTMVINELQQVAEMTSRRVAATVSLCDSGGAAFLQQPGLVALALHPVEDVTASAKKVYAPHLTVFAWLASQQVLLEVRGDPIPAANRFQPLKLGPTAIENFLTQNYPSKVLSNSVAEWTLSTPDGGFPLTLRFKLQKVAGISGLQKIVMERPLCLRNVY